jgi:DNA-binding response OmpR family regulator
MENRVQTQRPAQEAKGKAKILVVDDELPLAMMMVSLLARADFEVEAACSSEKALHKAKTEKFDLITLDVDMPGGSGFHLFERLKEIPGVREIPIVFVSGRSTHEYCQKALELGAADFIGKPFDPKQFVARIRKHLV